MKTQPLNPVLPNILFLIADDLRHDALGAAGNAEVYTPNLDRLASDGMRFRNACIQGGSHGAVCMPSRAMLHTGRSQFEIDGGGQTIATNHEMLGECLSRAGYHTHGIGKWHNDSTSYARSFQSGSEIFFRGMEDPWNMPLSNFDPVQFRSGWPLLRSHRQMSRALVVELYGKLPCRPHPRRQACQRDFCGCSLCLSGIGRCQASVFLLCCIHGTA